MCVFVCACACGECVCVFVCACFCVCVCMCRYEARRRHTVVVLQRFTGGFRRENVKETALEYKAIKGGVSLSLSVEM